MADTPLPEVPVLDKKEVPVAVPSVLSSIAENDTLPEVEALQFSEVEPIEENSLSDISKTLPVSSPETPVVTPKVESVLTPPETLEIKKPSEESQKLPEKQEDPKLAQYLRADHVYQEMLRIESQEKIRLHLAIRYTLLMFAIFLVFAWIVSNRVIMFGFSEFVWLARIRDALFAVMAGLFSLTIWFGSVTWMRQILLIAFLRTIAIVFFAAVIVALYLPLW